MTEEEDDFTRYEDLLPEGATPLYGFRAITYLNDEGLEHTAWRMDGSAMAKDWIALLEWVKELALEDMRQDGLLGKKGP